MTRKIDCDKCRGGGAVECPQCHGEGTNEHGETCTYCAGFGDIICDKCDGSGEIEVEVDDTWASMGW